MKESLLIKLDVISDRYGELSALLSDQEIISDQKKFRALSQEYAEIEPVVNCFQDYRNAEADIDEAESLLKDEDPDMREMASEAIAVAKQAIDTLSVDLQRLKDLFVQSFRELLILYFCLVF